MEKELHRTIFSFLTKIWRVLPGVRMHGSAPGGGRSSLNSPKAGATTLEAMPKLVKVQMNLFKTFLNLR